MITKENYSPEALRSILDAAFFDSTVDSDGDLMVKGDYLILVNSNAKFVRLTCVCAIRHGVLRAALLESVNRINSEFNVPRAYVVEQRAEQAIVLDDVLTIGEGLTPRSFVESIRYFEKCIPPAVEFFKDHVK